jgi:hypothetical protein
MGVRPVAALVAQPLSKRSIALATNGQDPESIAGGDVWSYQGKNLASIAAEFLDSDQAATDDL